MCTPSISVEEEPDEAEVDSLAEGSVEVESEDRFDWASDEAPRRPDSLKGIQSFQRSHSNLASLGLAFPAPNGSLAVARWPNSADRGSMPEDWESYTYSPGYERAHSKTESNDRYAAVVLFHRARQTTYYCISRKHSQDFLTECSISLQVILLIKSIPNFG